MQDVIEIRPLHRPLRAAVRPPGSKSLTNRALLLAALAEGRSQLRGVLDSEDTRLMAAALGQLGIAFEADWKSGGFSIPGSGGKFHPPADGIFCGNSGTTLRFLTAALACCGIPARLSGTPRMHERPIGDLLSALRQLGASLTAESPGECPPVFIQAAATRGGTVAVRGGSSSQYLSALLMAAPLLPAPLSIAVDGPLVSEPYVNMTLAMMREFGVEADTPGNGTYRVRPSRYQACSFQIEPDASAASYFFAAAAIAGGSVTIEGLARDSLQGDLRFVELLKKMGCQVEYGRDSVTLTGPAVIAIDCDLSGISDTAQTLAAVALFVEGTTTLRGIAHNRLKETDRIGNLARELGKLGASVEELADGLRIAPGNLRSATIETWGDHRMAMSLALVGLRQPGIRIADPDCVRKTFPDYFSVLADLTTD